MPKFLDLYLQLVFGLLVLLAASPLATAQTNGTSNSIETVSVKGVQRSFALERLQAEATHGKLPMIIYLHGIGGDITKPEGPSSLLPFDTLPNIQSALIIRPQGLDRKWNAPAADAGSHRAFVKRLLGLEHAPADDIGFLLLLVDTIIRQKNGDPDRVYVVGVSAGGYMAAWVACELNDTVAAVAILAATARLETLQHCKGGRSVPVLLMVSTTDHNAPYAGNDHDASGPEVAWFFKNRNGCTIRTETPIAHQDEDVDATVSLMAFTKCRDNADALFFRLDGSGHNVLSKAPVKPEDAAIVGIRNGDIDTAQVVWDFFRNKTNAQTERVTH